MLDRQRIRRMAALTVAAATIVAGCSGSDDNGDPSVPPGTDAPETTEDTTGTTEPAGLTGDGLEIGLLAPAPGVLSTLFRGQDRGLAFATEDVDEGGGVLDGPLTVTTFADEPGAEAGAAAEAGVAAGLESFVGPAGSDAGDAVRDVVGEAGGLACSASASIPRITLDQGDNVALVRAALPDDVVTTYLTHYITERRDAAEPGAAWTVAIVARTDDYGVSISGGLALLLQAAGMNPVVVDYDPRRVQFTGEANEVAGIGADVTVLVSYAEGANLLASLVQAGVDPATMIGLDAFFRARIADIATPGADADPAAVDGFTLVGSMGNNAFLERLYEDDDNGEVSFAPQAYDCAVVLALAHESVAAGQNDSLAAAAIDVTGDGTTCSTYTDCLESLRAGENIDYDGVSGRIDLDENGDPTWARFTTAVLRGGEVTDITATDVDLAEMRRQYEAYAAAAQIAAIQQALRFLGFYDGPINGLDTEEYRAALAAFQASVGLPPTGIFDAATDAALRAALGPYADLLTATTTDIQRLLTDLGFYDGPIDGVWSAEVTEAMRALQRELGVPETGVFDAATVRAIYQRGQDSATTTTTVPATTVPPTTVPPTVPDTTVPPTTMPPPPIDEPRLIEVLRADPQFSMLVELIDAAGLDASFQLAGPNTVFAPTNDAFASMSDADFEALKTDPNLLAILAYHVVEGRYTLAQLTPGLALPTLYDETVTLPIGVDGTTVTVAGAPIVSPDHLAVNGVVHGVGTLLAPPAAAV